MSETKEVLEQVVVNTVPEGIVTYRISSIDLHEAGKNESGLNLFIQVADESDGTSTSIFSYQSTTKLAGHIGTPPSELDKIKDSRDIAYLLATALKGKSIIFSDIKTTKPGASYGYKDDQGKDVINKSSDTRYSTNDFTVW